MSYTEDQNRKNPEPWKTNYIRESYAREGLGDNEELIEARRVDFDNWLERHDAEVRAGAVGRTRLTVPTDEALWDFADELLDAWNIEDTNVPSLSEVFRDRFVARFGHVFEVLVADALVLAGKGVQSDDGHSYLVPARDLALYSETIRALLTHMVGLRRIDVRTRKE